MKDLEEVWKELGRLGGLLDHIIENDLKHIKTLLYTLMGSILAYMVYSLIKDVLL